jgi:hypothetical protein
MGFQVSPGVQVKEIDLTNVIPAVSTSIGAIAGTFQWGPVEEIVTVGSERELVEIFGKPDLATFPHFIPAASFLKYGNSLKVVRCPTANKNASTGTAGTLVKNELHYDTLTSATGDEFWAKYPGTMGNSLQIQLCGRTAFAAWTHGGEFDSAPGTSKYASDVGGVDDEMHVLVIDEDGSFTGTAGTILEVFPFVSQAKDAKAEDGTNNYYVDVLNDRSRYVWFAKHDTTLTKAGDAAASTTFVFPTSAAISHSFTNGTDVNDALVANMTDGYDMFRDPTSVDINLIIGGQGGGASATPTEIECRDFADEVIKIAEDRKDAVAFVSPGAPATVGVTAAAAVVNLTTDYAAHIDSSSYGVIDSTAIYVYDKYNDVYRWVTASGHVAGLCAGTDLVADPWFSPAGFNRGQLHGVTKLAFNPNLAHRDTLYKARINPICSFPGEGTILFGDKTAQSKPSAFDRINVRRLFIVLEKAISTAAKYMLFEFNDEFTRAQFRNMVEPFLRDVKGRRGVYDFHVVCDETNNTGQVIDAKSFVADIYIKPSRAINFMTLNFIATRTGVEFSELVGR